ncbi:dermonecrotic toxin domain-containing protein, partial [Pseudomonas marginalis]
MKKPEVEPVVVYIPGAPFSALKEYPSLEAFQYELGLNLRLPAYQQLFASLVPQGNGALFLQRLN